MVCLFLSWMSGCEERAVDQMLVTIGKIKNLPSVQELTENHESFEETTATPSSKNILERLELVEDGPARSVTVATRESPAAEPQIDSAPAPPLEVNDTEPSQIVQNFKQPASICQPFAHANLSPTSDDEIDNVSGYACCPDRCLGYIVNGQAQNRKFVKDFFEALLESDALDAHLGAVSFLNSVVFDCGKTFDAADTMWYLFFKALREMGDQRKAHDLLLKATMHMFKDYYSGFSILQSIYTLTLEQLNTLPLEEYKEPELQLLLAILTDRLDDQLIDRMKGKDWRCFFSLFEPSFRRDQIMTDDEYAQRRGFHFKKDILYLKRFLLWVLNRPSIDPVRSIWSWINDAQATMMLRNSEIVQDPVIQGHIRRLGLTVDPPDFW